MDQKNFYCCDDCGMGFGFMQEDILLKLFDVEKKVGTPLFRVTSSIRCPKHNRKVGGSEYSAHLRGEAVDLLITDGRHRDILLRACMPLFCRIGVTYDNIIHVDVSKTLPQNVMW